MSYTVKVDGITYYCNDLNTQHTIESSSGAAQQKLLNEALKNGAAAEFESDLQTYQESSGYTYGTPTTSSGSKTVDANPDNTMTQAEIEKSAQDYAKSVGLTDLGEDSDIDDVIKVYENVAKTVKEIDSEIKSLDYKDPEKVEDEIIKINNSFSVVSSLLQAIGEDTPEASSKQLVGGIAACVGGAIATCIGVAVGVSVVAAGASLTASTIALGVAGCTVEIPVAGWIVAGVALVVAGVCAIFGYAQQKEAERKFNELKDNLKNTAEDLDGNMKTVTDNYTQDLKTETEKANTEIGDLISDDLQFEDLTDTNKINNNIDKIIEYQEKFEPHLNVCNKYQIESQELTAFMQKIGSGNQRLYRAQSYLDKYAQNAKVELGKSIGQNTEDLNAFYDKIGELISSVKKKGLDTSSLERIQKNITIENNREVYTLSDEITNGKASSHSVNLQPYSLGSSSGSTGSYSTGSSGGSANTGLTNSVKGLVSNAGVANTSAQEVQDNSSAYQTSTSRLSSVEDNLIDDAQDRTDTYGESLKSDGKSIQELYGMIQAGRATSGELDDVSDTISTSSIDTSISTAGEVKQDLSDKKAEEIEQSVMSTNVGADIKAAIENVNKTQEEYKGLEVDTSRFDAAYSNIVQHQQEFIDQTAQNLEQQGTSTNVGAEIKSTIDNINATKEDNQGIEVDTSGLDNANQNILQNQQAYVNQTAQNSEQLALSATDGASVKQVIDNNDLVKQDNANIQVDTTKLDTANQNILQNQQMNVDQTAQFYTQQASAITNGAEIQQTIDNIDNTKQDKSVLQVDTTKLDEAKNFVMQRQQNIIAQSVAAFEQQANTVQKADDIAQIIQGINTEIQNNQGFDTSKLQALALALQEKEARMKEEEAKAELEDTNTKAPSIGSLDDDVVISIGEEAQIEQNDSFHEFEDEYEDDKDSEKPVQKTIHLTTEKNEEENTVPENKPKEINISEPKEETTGATEKEPNTTQMPETKTDANPAEENKTGENSTAEVPKENSANEPPKENSSKYGNSPFTLTYDEDMKKKEKET